jgi:DNA-binding transcriptional LysR family regulator
MQPSQNQRSVERVPVPPRPAGARLLDYLGAGAGIAILPDGMALAVQAEHLVEVIRLSDFCGPPQSRHVRAA